MRIFFSILSASALAGGVHSPISNVKPYLANKARAFSSWIALLAAAVFANRGLESFVLGLMSLMDCWMAAGTDGVAVVVEGASAGAVAESSAAGVFAVSSGSLSQSQKRSATSVKITRCIHTWLPVPELGCLQQQRWLLSVLLERLRATLFLSLTCEALCWPFS